MTRYLAHIDQSTLLADLASNGFVFDNPEPLQVIQNGQDACIYLGQVPLEDGTFSVDFCANVTTCEGMTFETEITEPTNPYNKFAE